MALIAKIFSADLGDENAKGNLLPQDLGAILGFLNPHDAGILNIPEKDCSQFGSINITGQTAIVTFHAGYIVIHGRLVYIEEGTEVAFNLPTSGSVNGVLGIKINLAESGANEVTWFQKTSGVVTEDLIKKETDGIYEFVLYNYTATDLAFTLGAKTTQVIDKAKDISETLLQQVFVTQPLNDKSNKVATTEFVKASCGLINIEGTLKIQAYDRGNTARRAEGKYSFVGNGTFALNKNGRIVWQGNLVSEQVPTEVIFAGGDNADIGYVFRVNLKDFTITKVNGDTVTTSYSKILDLGVLFHNTVQVNENGGRSIFQGGEPNTSTYYALEDGKAVRLDRKNRLRINGMVIEFEV